MGADSAIPLQKTHNIAFEPRRLCYRWHPWYDHIVLTRKAGGAHADVAYFCKLPEVPLHAMLFEIPRWMFDAAQCATMRLAELFPHVDCATLRALRSMIAEQCVSAEAVVLQPQLSRQAGHGGTDGNDSKRTPNCTAGAVRPTPRRTTLERSHPTDPHRSGKTSGATAGRRSGEQSKPHSAEPRRTR